MTEIILSLLAGLVAIGGIAMGRIWGHARGKHAGKTEAQHDAMEDKTERVRKGRKAVGDGRAAGDPADRLRRNDDRW